MRCVKCQGRGPFIKCHDTQVHRPVYICVQCFGQDETRYVHSRLVTTSEEIMVSSASEVKS